MEPESSHVTISFYKKLFIQNCEQPDEYLVVDKKDPAWAGLKYGPWTDINAQVDFVFTTNHLFRDGRVYIRPRGKVRAYSRPYLYEGQ